MGWHHGVPIVSTISFGVSGRYSNTYVSLSPRKCGTHSTRSPTPEPAKPPRILTSCLSASIISTSFMSIGPGGCACPEPSPCAGISTVGAGGAPKSWNGSGSAAQTSRVQKSSRRSSMEKSGVAAFVAECGDGRGLRGLPRRGG